MRIASSEKRKESRRRYDRSEKGKARRRRYEDSEKGQQRKKNYEAKHPERKERWSPLMEAKARRD